MDTKLNEFAQYYVTLLDSLKVGLGANFVLFGDQKLLPGAVTICVDPSSKTNTLSGAASARALWRSLQIYVLVYCSSIADVHANRAQADQIAELVEEQIFARPRCGGLVLNVMVDKIESGFVNKGGTIVAASRLTITGEYKEILPNPVE